MLCVHIHRKIMEATGYNQPWLWHNCIMGNMRNIPSFSPIAPTLSCAARTRRFCFFAQKALTSLPKGSILQSSGRFGYDENKYLSGTLQRAAG